MIEETVVYKLDLVILNNDDRVLQSIKHELVLFFILQLFIDLMQEFYVDFLNEPNLNCEANDSTYYHDS